MTISFKNKVLCGAVLLLGAGTVVFSFVEPTDASQKEQKEEAREQIQAVVENDPSFESISKAFEELAQEKGGLFAYEILNSAELPQGVDLHLLGHVVGDVLYEQKGVEAIHDCPIEPRNSCSHSMVVGLFSKKGPEALDTIADICRNAPGGKGAYTMCFHGLGHGVLDYTGYNLEETVSLCSGMGTEQYNEREGAECLGGAIMEMIGGVNNRAVWEKQRPKYLNAQNPYSPCDRQFMPERFRPMCLNYLTPHFFELAGADLANPQPKHFNKAFEYCENLPEHADEQERNSCYRGFGKEFIVLANARDVRDFTKMSDAQLTDVYEWCTLDDTKRGTRLCMESAVDSLFWGGENPRSVAQRFCAQIDDPTRKRTCYSHLIGNVEYYIQDEGYRTAFCKELPREYQTQCRENLNVN